MDSQVTRVGRAGQPPATPGVIALSEQECWELLRTNSFGRIAFVVLGQPQVFPVNFATSPSVVVFRTAAGTKLSQAPKKAACFEIDGYDARAATGWSVMVQGTVQDITYLEDEFSRELRALPIHPAAPGLKLHWLAVRAHNVTGRRFSNGVMVPAFGEFRG